MLLRFVTAGDAKRLQAIYKPYVEETAISFEAVAPDEQEFERRILAVTATHPWLVAEQEGVVVGYAYASRHKERAAYRWSVDCAVYIDRDFLGKGTGKLLYTALLRLLPALGYYNAYAGITLPNERSVRVHERMGFKPVGIYENVGYKFGQWHDVGWWYLSLQDHAKEPAEPRSIANLAEKEAFLAGS